MNFVRILIGWLAANWKFFLIMVVSAALFLALLFPFSDLSDVVTSAIGQASGNQVYAQAERLDLHLLPQPAVSATNLSLETMAFPPIEAAWAKVTPGLFSLLFNIGTLQRALSGDPEAGRSLSNKVSISVSAEGVMGADVDLSLSPGKKSEKGSERSRINLEIEKLDLAKASDWASLPMRIQGHANIDTDMLLTSDFSEQPEGDFELKISKFSLPSGTISVPMGEASFPINIPSLTMDNVIFRGRMVGGSLVIEEGLFGKGSDPLSGRMKGQMALRLLPTGQTVTPSFGAYNLTVELNTNAMIQKELGFAFLPLDNAKASTSGGGARYLFRATGQGIGMAYVPQITRITSF